MLIRENTEEVHGQKKVGSPLACPRTTFKTNVTTRVHFSNQLFHSNKLKILPFPTALTTEAH